ncbi:MAG: hypothetical protein HY889_02665 [Deltaproteobacteria bacterium]|nr:hypothetical protein [Deltaproteobacteria bacterium]
MKRIFLLTAFVLLAGCTTVVRTQGVKIDREKVINIKTGETTRQDVLNTFGAPTDIVHENNEEKLIYVFKEKKVPGYLGGMVESEVQSKEAVTTLELVLRNDIVYSYRFKSSEN